jgi:hypothetical protein
MLQRLQTRGELPEHARPTEKQRLTITASSEDAARVLVRQRVTERGYKIRSLNRSTGNSFLVYVENAQDMASEVPRRG